MEPRKRAFARGAEAPARLSIPMKRGARFVLKEGGCSAPGFGRRIYRLN